MSQPVDSRSLIGYQLKRTQAALRARMDEALRPLGLTTPQYICLELLQRAPGASGSELARGAFVTRQTMSSLLHGLVEHGLAERRRAPTSGRALPVTLSPRGAELLTQATKEVRRIERQMLAALEDEQIDLLRTALTQCAQALE